MIGKYIFYLSGKIINKSVIFSLLVAVIQYSFTVFTAENRIYFRNYHTVFHISPRRYIIYKTVYIVNNMIEKSI